MIWSDCYATLVLAAVNTKRIRIGTGVAIPVKMEIPANFQIGNYALPEQPSARDCELRKGNMREFYHSYLSPNARRVLIVLALSWRSRLPSSPSWLNRSPQPAALLLSPWSSN
jgi:hypothetical protein